MKQLQYEPGTPIQQVIKDTNNMELAENIYNIISKLLPGDKLTITIEIKQIKKP